MTAESLIGKLEKLMLPGTDTASHNYNCAIENAIRIFCEHIAEQHRTWS